MSFESTGAQLFLLQCHSCDLTGRVQSSVKCFFQSKNKGRTVASFSSVLFLRFKHDEGAAIAADHISKLIVCLRDNIRSPDRKQLTGGLLELRAVLLAATVPLNSLQAVLFSFQDAVSSSALAGCSGLGLVKRSP